MDNRVITKELVEQKMNNVLSCFPSGGKVIAVRQNEWGEWIVDCKIPGHYSRWEDGPNGRYYKMEDADCPVRQFMVVLEYQESMFGMEPWWHTQYYEAKNDKRLPTFIEESGFMLDEHAPPSPYIVEPIKADIKAHENAPNPLFK